MLCELLLFMYSRQDKLHNNHDYILIKYSLKDQIYNLYVDLHILNGMITMHYIILYYHHLRPLDLYKFVVLLCK